jgi:hypothetical protein
MAQANRIQIRKGTQSEWELHDPVGFIGELMLDVTNKRIKAGDGFSEWTKLPYIDEAGLDDLRSEYGDETDFILQLELHK